MVIQSLDKKRSIAEAISSVLDNQRQELLRGWVRVLLEKLPEVASVLGEEEIKETVGVLLDALISGIRSGDDLNSPSYDLVRSEHEKLCKNLIERNINIADATRYVLLKKQPILSVLRESIEPEYRDDAIEFISGLVDEVALSSLKVFSAMKENIIVQQQKALLDISIPVVKAWDRILTIPLMGLLDSSRTDLLMETLLNMLENTQAKVVIIDISGIPIVDTLVAKNLLRTAAAAQLMGAQCIITGIQSRIAQTMIQLGVDLSGLITKSSMAEGLKRAFDLIGLKVLPK